MNEVEGNNLEGVPIYRADGVTTAERFLKHLCDKSFLTLWSYAGVYRDQGQTSTSREGKEVCDVLVVFENHIIIFSDKDCVFPDTGNLQLDWSRWFRSAIKKSADQIWGAERWLRQHPKRLYLDRACSQPFPIKLPDMSQAMFHRIVVAHDSSVRCRKELQGSGSLIIDHRTTSDGNGTPFVVGQIDPKRGFVHVFDDTSLNIVMQALDTLPDFVNYLSKKEAFVSSARFHMAAGEEELLAFFLQHLDRQGDHDFALSETDNSVVYLDAGLWDGFLQSPQYAAQQKSNKRSYGWDALIETFAKNMVNGTLYYTSHPDFAIQEKMMRYMAREPRLRRRMLANALFGLLRDTLPENRGARVLAPSFPGDPYFLFLLFPTWSEKTYEEYRVVRGNLLISYCKVLKLVQPDAQNIIGIAMEPGMNIGKSEDSIYYDATTWTDEEQREAQRIQKELGLFKNMRKFAGTEWEFPVNGTGSFDKQVFPPRPTRYPRNRLCICGSGKKYKHCHGK